jgi:DDE superfamily endonuclease
MVVSARTVRRYRKMLRFRPVHYRRRPLLTPQKEQERLYYCIDNMETDWKNIIFTDESTFVLTDEKEIIWKKPEEAPIMKPVKKYKESFMVWGGVWYGGRTDLCVIEGTVDAEKYQQILDHYLVRPGYTLEFDVLQDQATAHTAQSTDEFISEQGITMIDNPRSSPELNPIEKVWGWIKHEANKNLPGSLEEFKQLILKLWNEMDQNLINQYIENNPSIVNQIIEARGTNIQEKHVNHAK